jgi:hypothetical protein
VRAQQSLFGNLQQQPQQLQPFFEQSLPAQPAFAQSMQPQQQQQHPVIFLN